MYPQEAKQKEDELTLSHVKHGFATEHKLSEEFGSARNCNVTANKVGAYFNAILAKKEELMTLPDSSGRKKQQINTKDNFWPVTARNKATLDNWFKDLAGTKPLSSLAKKAPSFNKKEEIFAMLCENQVTMQRAAWFVKLSSAYTVAVSEAKIKKRQMPDPATEWTGTLIKFMKDLIPKLQEHFHQGPLPEKPPASSGGLTPNPNMTPSSNTTPVPLTSPATDNAEGFSQQAQRTRDFPPTNSLSSNSQPGSIPPPPPQLSPQEEQKLAQKQWNYCVQLCKYMYEEGLLDKHEFLNWILDLLDKTKSQPQDDGILRIHLPLTLQYMSDFVQSERLSRRLAFQAAKKLSHLLNSMTDQQQHQPAQVQPPAPPAPPEVKIESEDIKKEGEERKTKEKEPEVTELMKTLLSQYNGVFNEFLHCPHHRDLVMMLSSILQIITIECPTALVWRGIGENRSSSVLVGSPLDYLSVAPSALPMPSRCELTNNEMRKKLHDAEESIKLRSRHAESRWCTDKWQNMAGNSSIKILNTLDALDRHYFDRVDTNNSLDTLYQKIFPPYQPSSNKDHANGESKENKNEYVSKRKF